jgi:hypothetical protein
MRFIQTTTMRAPACAARIQHTHARSEGWHRSSHTARLSTLAGCATACALLATGCTEKPNAAPAPPLHASATASTPPSTAAANATAATSAANTVATAGICASGGGELSDNETRDFFERKLSGYCVAPNEEIRTYGENAKYTTDQVCTTAFDGECEEYKSRGLRRVVVLHYAANIGDGTVEAVVSKFSGDGAYSMFAKRVVADGDPAQASTPQPINSAGGAVSIAASAIGTGSAYLWASEYLIELRYNNTSETPKDFKRSSSTILRDLAASISARLTSKGKGGVASLPLPVGALPTEKLIPNGIEFFEKERPPFGRVGPMAIGHYRDGTARWVSASLARKDEAQAKDIFKTLSHRSGAQRLDGVGDEACTLTVAPAVDTDAATQWVYARKGARVYGVGDDAFALRSEEATAKRDALRITRENAIDKLKTLLGFVAPTSVAPTTSTISTTATAPSAATSGRP